MEDPKREGDDPSPADTASGDQPDPAATPNPPDGGDVPAEEGADEPADGSDDEPKGDEPAEGEEPEEPEDELPDDDDPKKTVPFKRLRSVIQQRNDHRAREETYKQLLLEHGIDIATGKRVEKKDGDRKKADLSKFKPEERENAKALLSALLEEEFGVIGNLKEQVDELKKHKDSELQERAQKEDDERLSTVLKAPEYKGITKEEVRKQVLKWDKSKDPELQALARSPYKYVVAAVKEMRDDKTKKKPKPSPKVETPSEDGPRKPDERDDDNPSDRGSFRRSMAAGAKAFFERKE